MPDRVLRRTAGKLAGVLLLTSLQPVWAQTPEGRSPLSPEHGTSQRDRVLSVARDLISASRYCTLVTVDALGQPQARIVDPLAPGDGLDVYIATNPLSRKVGEIRRDPRVTLLYFDASRPGYVTLVGRATEVVGPGKRAHHKQAWETFFPADKPETYTLLRFVPSRIEVVSERDGLSGDPATWRPEIVEIK